MHNFNEIQILPVTQASLAFLIQHDKVVLAMKKRGFGAGKWNGIGGKQDKGEAIEQTMKREVLEEIGVKPEVYTRAAILNFTFLPQPAWNQQVHVYLVTKWSGNPIETEEMAPAWFTQPDLPYEKMWSDDKLWLPRVLAGETLHATFSFDDHSDVVDYAITSIG